MSLPFDYEKYVSNLIKNTGTKRAMQIVISEAVELSISIGIMLGRLEKHYAKKQIVGKSAVYKMAEKRQEALRLYRSIEAQVDDFLNNKEDPTND